MPTFAQLLLPGFHAPPAPIPLAHAWLAVLELLRRAVATWAIHSGSLERAAAIQARLDRPLARRGDRAAIVRLRVMLAVLPPPAKMPLP